MADSTAARTAMQASVYPTTGLKESAITNAEASLGFAAGPNGSITQGGLAARLMPNGAASGTTGRQSTTNAIVELNPVDATALGVADGDEVVVASRRGEVRISVRLSRRVARKQVFIPMHYREAAVNLLTNPELDPYAHIPEFKVCAVSVKRVRVQSPEARADRTLATQAGD